jgi:hypothetical protein
MTSWPPEWFTAVLVVQDQECDPHAVTVYCAGANQVGGIPPSIGADAFRRGPSTQ